MKNIQHIEVINMLSKCRHFLFIVYIYKDLGTKNYWHMDSANSMTLIYFTAYTLQNWLYLLCFKSHAKALMTFWVGRLFVCSFVCLFVCSFVFDLKATHLYCQLLMCSKKVSTLRVEGKSLSRPPYYCHDARQENVITS